jgi:hypothetical protein
MKCPHCGISFHEDWYQDFLNWGQNNVMRWEGSSYWSYRTTQCSRCKDYVIEITRTDNNRRPIEDWRQVHPVGANRGPASAQVPPEVAQDYIEACNVLPISAKASAALSRRCLQHMLRSHGYEAKDLANEIDLLLKETDPLKALPIRLRETIDAIRNFGNFAAHPNKDNATLEIIDVEPHEAEWCLETIEELFEHFYVGPAIAAARKAALNEKLASIGKPPAK